MIYSVLLDLLVISLIPLCQTDSGEGPSRYECGKHGNFEYCINGIPGCVIGCHCHPGYYFDTETKICEPNSKLSEDFRRRYMLNPNQIYPVNTPAVVYNMPTQTTTNIMSDRIDEMSKDTDDLGEWLYNQFFKTIETQIINKTSADKPITRRKMNDVFSPDNGLKRNILKKGRASRKNMGSENDIKSKKKRIIRKSSKSRGKKGKSKVHGLRRKLLRITEDDSLFDSDSDSGSTDDTSSSKSSKSSSSSAMDISVSSRKNDHGHKKVVIFNRRPRPPLPSFIFLPNMDTPFYPPIGLPAPPVLPMYPMAPVPPMAPFFPMIDVIKNTETPTTTTTSATSNASHDTPNVTEDKTTTTTVADPSQTTPETVTDDNVPGGRSGKHMKSRNHKERRMPPRFNSEEFLMKNPVPSFSLTPKQMERLQLVKERIKMKKNFQSRRNNDESALTKNIDLYSDFPFIPENPELKLNHLNQKDISRNLNDVNFKYLSQLIHRAKLNNTNAPLLPFNHNEANLDSILKTRRLYDAEAPIIHHNEEYTTQKSLPTNDPADQYFMNLGRQIASLIRDEDKKVDSETTDTPEAKGLQDPLNSLLNENRYAPRSYWERFVRSPLTRLKSYLSGLHFNKQDKEMNLFSLEDEVNTFAKTERPFTLQDLENMLTSIQKTNSNFNNSYTYPKQSDVSFNVNLLPTRNVKIENSYRKMYEVPVNYIPSSIETVFTTKDKLRTPISNNTNYLQQTKDDWPMLKSPDFIPTIFTPKPSNLHAIDIMRNITKSLEIVNGDSKVQYYRSNNKMNTPIPKPTSGSQKDYLKFLKKSPSRTKSVPNKSGLSKYPELLAKLSELSKRHHKFQDKTRSLVKYNNINYFSDSQNNQHYLFETSYPLNMAAFKQSFPKRIDTEQPSYFHHEFHHFDYFD